MTAMKKRTAYAVTASVWAAAIGAAAALVYELNRPLHEVAVASTALAPLASALLACGSVALVFGLVVALWQSQLDHGPQLARVPARSSRHARHGR